MPEAIGSLSTPWDVIQDAQRPDAPPEVRRHCLEMLCQRYRDPVCAFIACLQVTDANDREDLTQTFFLRFLEDDWLSKLDRERGSFRGLLLTSLRHFVQREHKRADKRHPRSPLTRLSSTLGNVSAELVVSDTPDPAAAFNREWARQLLKDALTNFREECRLRGLDHYFAVYDRHDWHPERFGKPSYADTAAALGISEVDVNNYLQRARKRFAKTLWQMVRQTVDSDERADEEMKRLERFLTDG